MKKLFLLSFCLIALSQYSQAQTIVDATNFYDNPTKFNGRVITLKDITVRKSTAKDASIGAGVQVSTGAGNSSTESGAIRCIAPRGYEILDITFPNGKSKGCFVILNKVANPIPSGKNVTATITFKADSRSMNKISMIKFIP
jgi:hypothetical protein